MAEMFEVICKVCNIHNVSGDKNAAKFILSHSCLTDNRCREYVMLNDIRSTCELDKNHAMWHLVTIYPQSVGRASTQIKWSSNEVSTNV